MEMENNTMKRIQFTGLSLICVRFRFCLAMGCVSSKILTKSGSFQESVSHSFQRSNSVIEEIILSSSKSNGDQFLAILCKSSSSAQKAEQSAEVTEAADELPAKIETINVSELLAGLEEENCAAEQEKDKGEHGDQKDGYRSPAQCAASSDGGAAGRARSFRTVEEFDALVTKSGGSSERVPAPAPPGQEEDSARVAAASTSSHGAAVVAAERGSSGQEEQQAENAGAKRRARARQLGELKVPTAFDFSKSGSLRDWLLRGGQIFSPGSYVTPKFGTAPAFPAAEHIHIGAGDKKTGEKQPQHAVFDPELVAQFERAMEQLSEDEERVLTEILDALELEAGEKDGAAAAPPLGRVSGQPVAVAVRQDY